MRKIGQIFRFLIPVIALAAVVVFLTGAGRRERATEEKNKALVMRWSDELWNKGNMAVADEIIDSNIIRHDDTVPEGVLRGREAMKKLIMASRTAWPDFHDTPIHVIAQGDKVVWHSVCRGTFTGKVEGWPPPTGKEMAWEFLAIHRIAGGKIVETWAFNQDLVLLSQMGLTLVPAQAPAGK